MIQTGVTSRTAVMFSNGADRVMFCKEQGGSHGQGMVSLCMVLGVTWSLYSAINDL
jgi:hypothetical protein